MSAVEIYELLKGAGVPVAYYQFDDSTAEAPPFICWYFEDSDDLYADNINYTKIRPVTIELYTDEKDFELEEKMESLLIESGLSFTKNETVIESEKMYMIVYETEVIYHG